MVPAPTNGVLTGRCVLARTKACPIIPPVPSLNQKHGGGPMGKLDGKVAVVTGASKGIGASIARHLAAEGAAVVVNYASSKEGADAVVAAIEGGGGKAVAVRANLSDPADIRRL